VKDNVENRDMRVNMNKTKVMISGEQQKVMQKAARWPCGVCDRNVCTSCQKWVHKKCSGVKGSMSKVVNLYRLCESSTQYKSHKWCRYWWISFVI